MKIELHCDNGDVLNIKQEEFSLVNVTPDKIALILRGSQIFMTFDGFQVVKATSPVVEPVPAPPQVTQPKNGKVKLRANR